MTMHPLAQLTRSFVKSMLNIAGAVDSHNVSEMYSNNGEGFDLRRKRAVSYGPLFRAVTLTAQSLAWMVTEGHLRVTRMDGTDVNSRRSKRILDLMAGLPDGIRPAETLWADAGVDYAVFGNGLLEVVRDMSDVPVGLRLLEASTARTNEGLADPEAFMYSAARSYTNDSTPRDFHHRDVIHFRWPLIGDSTGHNQSVGLAESPLRLLDRDIRLGIASDMFVLDYFSGGSGGVKSKLAVGIKNSLDPDQWTRLEKHVERYKQGRGPLIIPGDPNFTTLNESPSDAETGELRKRQAVSTGRIYGIPSPLMSEEGSTWGSGIDALIRGYYRFGLRPHLMALLSACRIKLLLRGEKFAINELAVNRGDPNKVAVLLRALQGDAQRDQLASTEELRLIAGLPGQPKGELRKAVATGNNTDPDPPAVV